MNQNRRDFLKIMLAAASAPAIVKADNLMKLYIPDKKLLDRNGGEFLFHDGDFLIDSGVTVRLQKGINIVINGHMQINGEIIGYSGNFDNGKVMVQRGSYPNRYIDLVQFTNKGNQNEQTQLSKRNAISWNSIGNRKSQSNQTTTKPKNSTHQPDVYYRRRTNRF